MFVFILPPPNSAVGQQDPGTDHQQRQGLIRKLEKALKLVEVSVLPTSTGEQPGCLVCKHLHALARLAGLDAASLLTQHGATRRTLKGLVLPRRLPQRAHSCHTGALQRAF